MSKCMTVQTLIPLALRVTISSCHTASGKSPWTLMRKMRVKKANNILGKHLFLTLGTLGKSLWDPMSPKTTL
jgi:hypothetical protein